MGIVETSQRLRSIVTRRSLLPPPADRGDPKWDESWTYLFFLYRPAMTRYVRGILSRASGRPADPDEADDVVQDYFRQSIEKGWLSRDAEELRCFRAYLQTQLKRFTYKHLEHKLAQKRNPKGTSPPEALEGVSGREADPSAVELDRGWVEVAVEETLETLRRGNADYYEIIADLLRTEGEGSPDLGERLGRSPTQMTHLRHRARKRFGVLLHECLRETVRDDEAFDELCERIAPYLP